MRSRFVAAVAVLSVSLGVGATSALAHSTPGGPGVKVVASGLDNPRGLALGPFGTVFVAEAGTGGPGPNVPGAICAEGPFDPITCLGPTGAITLITPFGPHFRIVQGLPSFAVQEQDVEGTFALGPSDVSLGLLGLFFSVGGPGGDLTRSVVFTPAFAQSAGTIQAATFGGSKTVADLAAFELANDPDKQLHEANVQGVLAARSGLYAVDSAGNTFFRVGLGGNLELLHVFPNGTSDGEEFQAVPSALAEGPDGAIYISTLTGVPFPEGEAKVWRWTPDTGVQPFAEGFTSAVDLAFGPDGSLYVLEIFPHDVVRVTPGGSRDVVVPPESLTNPTGIAIGRDGSIYVSNCGTCAGTGEVLKFPPAPPAP